MYTTCIYQVPKVGSAGVNALRVGAIKRVKEYGEEVVQSMGKRMSRKKRGRTNIQMLQLEKILKEWWMSAAWKMLG